MKYKSFHKVKELPDLMLLCAVAAINASHCCAHEGRSHVHVGRGHDCEERSLVND